MNDSDRDFLAHRHLQAALTSWIVTLLGAVALALVIGELGYNVELAMLGAWLINLNTARHLGRAAMAQRRNPWLHGIAAAIWPVTAMAVTVYLYFRAVRPLS